MRMGHFIALLLLTIGLITTPLIVPTVKSTQPYSVFNRGEDGCYNFFNLMCSINSNTKPLIYSYSREDLMENSVLFIISPDLEFTEREMEILKDYVSSGNILVIADNFKRGNDILEYFNVSYRFSKDPLYDVIKPVEFYYGGYIVVENPSAVLDEEGEDNGTVVIYSSPASRVGRYPEPKKEFPYPIVVERDYNKGMIVLISDPSLFKNKFFKYNKEFLKSYFHYSGKSAVYFDECHHSDIHFQNIVILTTRSEYVNPEFLSSLFTGILISVIVLKELFELFIHYTRKLISIIFNILKYRDKQSLKTLIENVSEKHNLERSTLYKIVNRITGVL